MAFFTLNVVESTGHGTLLKDRRVQLTQRETRRLRLEARQTYREYGRIRRLPRVDRANPVLKGQLTTLRARYEELEGLLGRARGASEAANCEDTYRFDLSRFEPAARPSFYYTAYRGLQTDSSWFSRVMKRVPPSRLFPSLTLLCIVMVLVLLIANLDLGFYRVPSSSMEPTLIPNDHLISYSSAFYKRGQVVIIRDPEEYGSYLVKRIVGLPGDVVAVRGGALIVNGHRVEEPYLYEKMSYKLSPIRVGANEVFLLGDNRNRSHDSHIWKHGQPIDSIMGSVRHIYSPRSRIVSPVAYTDVFDDVDPKERQAGGATQGDSAS